MNEKVMVHKLNQITLYFASYPEDEAVAGIADHLAKFWEARMLSQLHSYVASGGAGIQPLALKAIATLPTAPPSEKVPY